MVRTREVGAAEWAAVKQVVDRLTQSYPDVSAETVQTLVHQNHANFDGRPVRDFVPLFVERRSRRQLTELGG